MNKQRCNGDDTPAPGEGVPRAAGGLPPGAPLPSGLLRRSKELDARESLIERRLSLLAAVEERIALKQHVAALLGDWGGVLSGEALAAAIVRVIDRHGAALSDDDRYAVAAALSRLAR